MFTLSWLGWATLTLVLTQVIIIMTTVYFHRACSHRSVVLADPLNRVFRFLAWFLISMDPQEFAAVHRKHHAKCDTAEDPHSPANHGWAGVLFGGLALYRRETANPQTMEQYGKGLPVDPWESFYRRFHFLGIFLLAGVLGLLLGWQGLVLWGLLMLWIPFWAAGVINGLGHHFGYRNYQTDDLSTNLTPWGLWVGGEELHNNHHAFPASARFSRRPWEFDLGWAVIRLFRVLGWASVREEADDLADQATTTQSFLRDRHAWLARFQEALDTHLRPALVAHGFSRWEQFSRANDRLSRLSRARRRRLEAALAHPALARAHQLELELRRFWRERGRLCAESLEAWRERARALQLSGVDAFANRLPQTI